MLDEKVIKQKSNQNSLHKIIQIFHSSEMSASFRQVVVFLLKQVPTTAQNRIPEVQNQVKLQEIVDVKSFQILKLQIAA